jgi:hypothetical protein
MMNAAQKFGSGPRRRRYLVHLLGISDPMRQGTRYIARVRPWTARITDLQVHEHTFADECELIATINPLLPPGSDVRDVFVHIESAVGFYYLMSLTAEEAQRLGWNS